jgi:CheY-like chemotaxis protein
MKSQVIMVVDDDEDILVALSELLENEGFRVVAVPNGQVALDVLSRGELPDLILLDLMMPVMDGWKFRAEQLVNPTLAAVPVIVITAVPSPNQATDLGVAVLKKPIDPHMLLATVRKHSGQVHRESARATSEQLGLSKE